MSICKKNVLIYVYAKIFKKMRGKAIIDSVIDSSSKIEAGSNIANTQMERFSFCGYDCEISNTSIGAFTSISDSVIIGGGTHPVDWVSMSPVFYAGRDSVKKKFAEHERPESLRTKIGHDVWIGHGVHIKQGVEIGTGAVVGMGSIVTRDVKPYTIVAGSPARVIKMRFEDDIIEGLLATKWWAFSDEELDELAPFMTNPRMFLERIQK
jgi:acetyltransferase-like isoleucine patch superfamily enzyme